MGMTLLSHGVVGRIHEKNLQKACGTRWMLNSGFQGKNDPQDWYQTLPELTTPEPECREGAGKDQRNWHHGRCAPWFLAGILVHKTPGGDGGGSWNDRKTWYWAEEAALWVLAVWTDRKGKHHLNRQSLLPLLSQESFVTGTLTTHWLVIQLPCITNLKVKWNYGYMDGPRVCHTEWSKWEGEKQIPYANTYIWNLKKKQKKGSEEPRGRTGRKTQT